MLGETASIKREYLKKDKTKTKQKTKNQTKTKPKKTSATNLQNITVSNLDQSTSYAENAPVQRQTSQALGVWHPFPSCSLHKSAFFHGSLPQKPLSPVTCAHIIVHLSSHLRCVISSLYTVSFVLFPVKLITVKVLV